MSKNHNIFTYNQYCFEEIKIWPYRFKTIDEFRKEYGFNWRNNMTYLFSEDMDYLLGTVLNYDFPDDSDEITIPDINDSTNTWWIVRDFLTENDTMYKPDYSPRKFDRTLNESYYYSNDELKSVDPRIKPKLKIGDKVKIKPDAALIHANINSLWTLPPKCINFLNENKDEILTIKSKFIGNTYINENDHYYWWSSFDNEMWFLDNSLILYQPDYSPKKFDRSLNETLNDITNASEIVVKINDIDELQQFKDLILQYPKYNSLRIIDKLIQGLNLIDFPLYIFINFITNKLSYEDESSMKNFNYDLTSSCLFNGVYNYYFSMKDTRHIKNMLDLNKILAIPFYEPKKFNRTLNEKFNNISDASEIVVKINDIDELQQFKDLILQYPKYRWLSTMEQYLNEQNSNYFPTYLFINFYSDRLTFATESNMKLINYDLTSSDVFDGVYNYYFSMKDVRQIKNMLNQNKILIEPNYNPKKIIRDI